MSTNMNDIVQFSEFLIKTVREEEKKGNRSATDMLQNYLEVINDGIQHYENDAILKFESFCGEEPEYLKKLKEAKRILK